MTLSTPRTLIAGLAALAASAAPQAQVVFDTFNDGSVTDIGTFQGPGVGIRAGITGGQGGADNAGLSITINPGDGGSFAGFVIPGPAGVTDVSGQTALTFYIRPTTVQAANLPITLQVNLHEDIDEDGAFNGAVEDEYQTLYSLTAGEGYSLVRIPLSAFTDDNSIGAGADDGFDYTKLSEIVIAIDGLQGPEFAFAMDDIVFIQDTPGTLVFRDFESDDPLGRSFQFSQNNAGVSLGTTDGAADTDTGLSVTIDGPAAGAFAGFGFGGGSTATTDGVLDALTFYLRPDFGDSTQPFNLEINLQEDANGDGTYDPATEDEFQAIYRVAAGADDYGLVSIPISDFTDDNSVNVGANDGFDYSRILQLVFAIGGTADLGDAFTLSLDEFAFAVRATAEDARPEAFAAAPRTFPNPTTGAATVAFGLAAPSEVAVAVYDLLGRQVAEVTAGAQAAGPVEIAVPTASLSAGVYLVRVTTAEGAATTRLTVAR